MGFKKVCLWVLCGLWLNGAAQASEPSGLVLGGLVRAGGFSLSEQETEQYPGGPSFTEADYQNSLHAHYLAEHWISPHLFYGWMYHRYYFSDEQPDLNQTADLRAHFFTLGGAWDRVDAMGRRYKAGLSLGYGQAQYENNLTDYGAGTGSWAFHSSGTLWRAEVFLQVQIRSGWGYRAGYALQQGQTDSDLAGKKVSLNAGPFPSMTLVWQPQWF